MDTYGGFESITADATGHFRTERIDGVWWLIDPDGRAFFSSGVNNANPVGDFVFQFARSPYLDGVLERYGSRDAWADVTRDRLRSWGVNTLGGFSAPGAFGDPMPYTVVLEFTQHAPPFQQFGGFPVARDYLGPWFETAARSYALEQARACADDRWCIGVFTDNEPTWGQTPSQPSPYLYAYTALPAGASAKVELQRFLTRRYDGDVTRFNAVWGTQLAGFDDFQNITALPTIPATESPEQRADNYAVRDFVAERYFKITHDSLRAVSEDLLILGPRFATNATPASLYEIAAPYVDVMSLNNYELAQPLAETMRVGFDADRFLFAANPWDDLDEVARLTDKPTLISEFSYRARVPGGPQGTIPPGFPYLPDQPGRAQSYRSYMAELYSRPSVVGAHWFQYMDQPAQGRGDGQDSNWGLVDIDDQPWRELVAAVKAENRALPDARVDSG